MIYNIARAAALCFFVTLLAMNSSVFAASTPEKTVVITPDMTIAQVAEEYGLPKDKLAKKLGVNPVAADNLPISMLGIGTEKVRRLVRHYQIEGEKDWTLIFVKFGLWLAAVTGATVLLMRRGFTLGRRVAWMIAGVAVFGVILGPDPNPMGTVKDAVVLYAQDGMIFPPRMIALGIFLGMVIVSNKSICGWGCQFGMLQDVINRIPTTKYRLPFSFTNTVRGLVFAGIFVAVFGWGLDFIGLVDPFRVFRLDFTTAALVFIPLVLIVSVFVYRPWCRLACPFGFAGWLAERISILRPRIDREACLQCEACTMACPTAAMRGIYDGRGVYEDCFACSECVNICPANAISWGTRKK